MGELAPLLKKVMSSFGQPATMAEKWAAELTKAWVTTVEDAARLLALEREEKRNGVTKLSEGWRNIIKASGAPEPAWTMIEAKLMAELDTLVPPPSQDAPHTPVKPPGSKPEPEVGILAFFAQY